MNFMKLGQEVKVSTIFKEWNTRYQAIMSILLSAFDRNKILEPCRIGSY